MADSVRTHLLACFVAFVAIGLGACEKPAPPSTTTRPLSVFAAASLADALSEAARLYESRSATRIITNFAASSTLAQQIKAGANADIFISADVKWMDELAAAGRISIQTRFDLLGNDLVLIAPKDKPFTASMSAEFDFAGSLPDVKRIAVADPSHVPAGRYARQSLGKLGWWPTLQPRLLPAQDVRAALRLVELGEADAGIVYSTDATASSKVAMVAVFPADSHDPIVYPIARVRRDSSAQPATDIEASSGFVKFLRSPEAAAIFTRHGFRVPSRP